MLKSRVSLIKEAKKRINQELNARAYEENQYKWALTARESQKIPEGSWRVWLILAGRGFGKTRTGSETIRQWVVSGFYRRIALVADTQRDGRDVMIEGQSGLLAIHPEKERPLFEASKGRLKWPNGALATLYSGEDYEKLRGPQFDCAWVDELAKFRTPEKVWDQLQFSLRLGVAPKVIVTTTPRSFPLLNLLLSREGEEVFVTRGTTFENAAHLSPDFMVSIKEKYEGTQLGRQELYGEMLSPTEGALWTYDLLERQRVHDIPSLKRLVVAIDPAASCHEKSDETGIVVAGVSEAGVGYVLEDLSGKYSPGTWSSLAVEAYQRWKADRVVAEVNKGGDLVEKVLRSVGGHISYKGVHASRGKMTRAEPIAALYEQGKVFHVDKGLERLEAQMCSYAAASGQPSPDRLDALVWALTELMLSSPEKTSLRVWKM